MSGNMKPATWSSSYTQSPHGTGTLALHGLSRATRHPRRAEKRNRASVPNQVPRVGRGWWAGFSEKPLSPGTRAEQLAEAPLGEAPPPPRPGVLALGPGPWGRGRCWGKGQKAQVEDGPHGTGCTRTALASKGKRGHFRPPPRRSPHQRVCPKCPWPWEHMRPRPGQGAREAPRGQRGVPRQPWPLILLGLASYPVGTHGLLPLMHMPPAWKPRQERARGACRTGKGRGSRGAGKWGFPSMGPRGE